MICNVHSPLYRGYVDGGHFDKYREASGENICSESVRIYVILYIYIYTLEVLYMLPQPFGHSKLPQPFRQLPMPRKRQLTAQEEANFQPGDCGTLRLSCARKPERCRLRPARGKQ